VTKQNHVQESMEFTGIDFVADSVVIFLGFMASLQTFVFWVNKQVWYALKTLYTLIHAILIKFLFEYGELGDSDKATGDAQMAYTAGTYI